MPPRYPRLSLSFLALLFLSQHVQSQNVGIGTSSPLHKLHVAGNHRVDGALILNPPAAFTPAAAIAVPDGISTAIISLAAGSTANSLTPPPTPYEGQVLYITNQDDDAATFAGYSIAALTGINQFIYLNGAWRQVSAQPASAGGGWSLTGNAGTVPGTGPGQNFIGTTDAQDWIVATNSAEHIRVGSAGAVRITGDLINQELTGNAIACTTNVVSPVPGGPVASTSLGLPTNIGGTTTRSTSQPLVTYNDVASACIIDGTTQSITITDGSGVNNSGVLVMGTVAVRTLNTAVLPNSNRFQIWLQRSNDGFVSNSVNVWRTESSIGSGLPVSAPYNMATGNMTVPIIFPDLALAPGTYTYRLVFQGGNYGTGAGVVNYEALDRSLVLLQVKR